MKKKFTFGKNVQRYDARDNHLAIIKLRKALDLYDLGSSIAEELKNKVSGIPTLKYMNMEYLAAALFILERLGNKNNDRTGFTLPEPKDMQTDQEPLNIALDKIIIESGKDTEKDIIKYKQVLLTYMVKVYKYVDNSIEQKTETEE